jgi:hypothetical protein
MWLLGKIYWKFLDVPPNGCNLDDVEPNGCNLDDANPNECNPTNADPNGGIVRVVDEDEEEEEEICNTRILGVQNPGLT